MSVHYFQRHRTVLRHNCEEWFYANGMAAHRAAHFRRGEVVTMTLTNGETRVFGNGRHRAVEAYLGRPMPKRRGA